jgi:proline dehydrogenase
MLLGVRENLSSRLIAAGERVRIYVPYGDAWYAYSVRRLRENPSIAGYVARDVLRSFVPGM